MIKSTHYVQARTPEEFFAYVEKVKALHKTENQKNKDKDTKEKDDNAQK